MEKSYQLNLVQDFYASPQNKKLALFMTLCCIWCFLCAACTVYITTRHKQISILHSDYDVAANNIRISLDRRKTPVDDKDVDPDVFHEPGMKSKAVKQLSTQNMTLTIVKKMADMLNTQLQKKSSSIEKQELVPLKIQVLSGKGKTEIRSKESNKSNDEKNDTKTKAEQYALKPKEKETKTNTTLKENRKFQNKSKSARLKDIKENSPVKANRYNASAIGKEKAKFNMSTTEKKIMKVNTKKNKYRIIYRVEHGQIPKYLRSDTLFIIMPTYARQLQRPLLTMQAQVFSQVPNAHIIVAEDAEAPSPLVNEVMTEHNLNFTQVACSLPNTCTYEPCLTKKNVSARGAIARNCALTWIQKSPINKGVIYFADDDNFYHLNLFKELRKTRKVALFPVGGFRNTWLSSVLLKNGSLTDFTDIWKGNRKWPIDMAGFSVTVGYWKKVGSPKFIFTAGYLETKFLGSLKITKKDIDILGSNATKVYVWHNSLKRDKCMKKEDYQELKKLENHNYDNLKALTKDIIFCK